MKVFVNAGHYRSDPGSKCGTCGVWGQENLMTMAIRDFLRQAMAGTGYIVEYVPDNLDLRDSIAWVNERALPSDFAIDIHLNSNSDARIKGAEAYYHVDPRRAQVFSAKVAAALGIPNRGPKPDTMSFVGELGWLRKLKCPSVVVECAYLSNPDDRAAIMAEEGGVMVGFQRTADGIREAIAVLFPVPPLEEQLSWIERKIAELWQILKSLRG